MAYITTSHSAKCKHIRHRTSFLDLLAVYRQRRALSRLDAHALDDLGITADQAKREARRPFWDIPTK